MRSSREYLAQKMGKNKSKSRGGNRHNEGSENTIALSDYLTAYCDSGATSFLLTANQVQKLRKSLDTHTYKLTGPHRLWFTASLQDGSLRWASQSFSPQEESLVKSFGTLSVRQPETMTLPLQNIIEIKKGSPSDLVLPVSPRNSPPKKSPFSPEQLPPPHLFTLKSKDGRFMILQAPNQRKLDTWVETLRKLVFEYGTAPSQRLTRRDVAWAASTDMGGEIITLGRGRLTGRVTRRHFFELVQGNDSRGVYRFLSSTGGENLINITDSKSNSALMLAARSGSTEVLRMLLEFGAQVNASNGEGYSPVQLATRYGHLECVETLLQVRHIVSSSKDIEADIELLNDQGKSILHFAVSHDKPMVVKMLCEYASDLVDWPDNDGDTPLHLAAKYGMETCLQVLLETAAEPNFLNRLGKTPYTLAADRGQKRCKRILKQYGGSRRGYLPNNGSDERQEMDMDRIMQIWSAFLENATKAYLNPSMAKKALPSAPAPPSKTKHSYSAVNDTMPRAISLTQNKSQVSTAYEQLHLDFYGKGKTLGEAEGNDKPNYPYYDPRSPAVMYDANAGGGSVNGEWEFYENSGGQYWYNHFTGETRYNNEGLAHGAPSTVSSSTLWAQMTSNDANLSGSDEIWSYRVDECSGHAYWFNNVTSETQWADSGEATDSSSALGTTNGVEEVWEWFWDDKTNSAYWWNSVTGEVQWSATEDVVPILFDPATVSIVSTTTLQATLDEGQTNDSAWEYCLEEVSGRAYWYNHSTQESTWAESTDADMAEYGVWEWCTDSMSGRSYWFNGHSGESQWAD